VDERFRGAEAEEERNELLDELTLKLEYIQHMYLFMLCYAIYAMLYMIYCIYDIYDMR